jgi:hypothetical protein
MVEFPDGARPSREADLVTAFLQTPFRDSLDQLANSGVGQNSSGITLETLDKSAGKINGKTRLRRCLLTLPRDSKHIAGAEASCSMPSRGGRNISVQTVAIGPCPHDDY